MLLRVYVCQCVGKVCTTVHPLATVNSKAIQVQKIISTLYDYLATNLKLRLKGHLSRKMENIFSKKKIKFVLPL